MDVGFTSPAIVCPTTHDIVLSAVVHKLQADITEFSSDSTCFLSNAAVPGIEINEGLFCTVAPGDTTFEDRSPIGAANRGIVETMLLQVTIWSRIQLDRLEHSARTLTDATRGLLKYKRQVLQSLAGVQIYADAPVNSVPLLVEFLRPVRAMHSATKKSADDLASTTLIFQGTFCWDLDMTF